MSSGASDDAADSAQKNKRMRQGTKIILHRATQTRLGFFNVIPGRTEQGLGTSKEESHMERAKTKLCATLSLSEITQCKSVYKLRRKRKCIHHSAAAMATERGREQERASATCGRFALPKVAMPHARHADKSWWSRTHTHTHAKHVLHTHTHAHRVWSGI